MNLFLVIGVIVVGLVVSILIMVLMVKCSGYKIILTDETAEGDKQISLTVSEGKHIKYDQVEHGPLAYTIKHKKTDTTPFNTDGTSYIVYIKETHEWVLFRYASANTYTRFATNNAGPSKLPLAGWNVTNIPMTLKITKKC